MKSTIEELSVALENMPMDELNAMADNDSLRETFLRLHGWTLEEFRQAIVDLSTNGRYLDDDI